MKLSKLSCAVLSVIALSACGGGGGGGSSGSHNNQEEPQPQPQPIEETGVVVQDFQFNAFSSLDAAEVVTGGNFDSNSKTTVCLDLSHDNSCQDEQYSVSGTGLSFSNKLEWPEDLDVSGMNIIADNNNFVYSIPADSGINGVVAQGTSVQKRIKVYINPASNALHADKLGIDVILGGYTGAKYSSSDFSAQKDYSALDQEIITFADTLVSVLNYSNKEKLAYIEVRDIVSGALQKIIDALKDLSVSPVQIVVSVDTHNDYNHLANNVNPDPEVPVTNNPPVADFNFEVSADGAVIFSNNSSDPENDKLTYKWKFGDNAESDEASPTHKYKKNGKYTVYLNVTDSGNLSNYITKKVNVDSISEGGNDNPVADENNAPIAYFYYEDTDEGLVKFTNNSSDPDNDKLTYKWNFGDNSESNKKSPNHTFKKNGMYTVTLTVTDSHNLTSTITKDVIVASVSKVDPIPSVNKEPVANFYYEDTDEGLVTFTNNSSDPDNDKLTYKWNFGDNSESNKKSPSHTFKKNGMYTVTLTVTDSHNLTSTITKDVIVASVSTIDPPMENSAPEANFSYSVGYNREVTFINTSTDSDGDLLTSTWCIEGTKCFNQTDDLEYTFSQAGTYKVTLSVSDGNKVSTITHDVIVTDKTRPGTPAICSSSDTLHFDVDVNMGSKGLLTFYNKSYDVEGNKWSYKWRFKVAAGAEKIAFLNDPSMKEVTATEFETYDEIPQVTYTKMEGTHQVTLVATNDCGVEKEFDIAVKIPKYQEHSICKSIKYNEFRTSLSEATMIGDVECKAIDDGITAGLVRDCKWLPDTKVAVNLSNDIYGARPTLINKWGSEEQLGDRCQQIIKFVNERDGVLTFGYVPCGEYTEHTINGICVGYESSDFLDRYPTGFDNKYIIAKHDKSVVPLAVPANASEIVNINTVTNAVAYIGAKRLLKNYTGNEYSDETFSYANSYELLDDSIKVLGDTVFYLLQLGHYGRLSLAEIQTKAFDGLEAITEAKTRGVTDDQILHNVVKYEDYEHLKEVQPDLGGNRPPIADSECYYTTTTYTTDHNPQSPKYTTTYNLDLYASSSDPDNDELSLERVFLFPKSYYSSDFPVPLVFDKPSEDNVERYWRRFGGANLQHEYIWDIEEIPEEDKWHQIHYIVPTRFYYRVSDGKVFKFDIVKCKEK